MGAFRSLHKKLTIINSEMKNILNFAVCILFMVIPQLITGQVNDINGQKYKTKVIGSQILMAENLNVDRFKNGDLIP